MGSAGLLAALLAGRAAGIHSSVNSKKGESTNPSAREDSSAASGSDVLFALILSPVSKGTST